MTRIALLLAFITAGLFAEAQELLPNQNPNYAQSRDKYMKIADSLTQTQSTTSQETYKAIDYLADKAEEREKRREARRAAHYYNTYYPYDYPYSYRYSYRYGRYPSYYRSWDNPVTWGTVGSPFFWYWMFR